VRFARYSHDGVTGVGLVADERLLPIRTVRSIGEALADPDRAVAAADERRAVGLRGIRWLPSVDEQSRVFAVAQNYPAHAQEISGTSGSPTPLIFLKTLSSLVGHEEPMELQPVTKFFDYEAEVAVVIGGPGYALAEAEAASLIAGVTAFNDGTGRDLQPTTLGGRDLIDWFSAKCLDRSSPIGPWVTPVASLDGDLADLALCCRVNGEEVQRDTTASMLASPARLAAFISHRVALRAGDVIATGTPGGVGRARGVALKDGDVLEVEVEGVGVLRNSVHAQAS
jgi:acylpyruvate hydrolase